MRSRKLVPPSLQSLQGRSPRQGLGRGLSIRQSRHQTPRQPIAHRRIALVAQSQTNERRQRKTGKPLDPVLRSTAHSSPLPFVTRPRTASRSARPHHASPADAHRRERIGSETPSSAFVTLSFDPASPSAKQRSSETIELATRSRTRATRAFETGRSAPIARNASAARRSERNGSVSETTADGRHDSETAVACADSLSKSSASRAPERSAKRFEPRRIASSSSVIIVTPAWTPNPTTVQISPERT